LVNKLVALGLVKKEESEEDARVSYVRLTDKGRGFQDVFYNISLHLVARLFQGFSDNEQKQLENLLGRVLENMQ
jgi:DNA-binding MarR family transcriptional regulator